MVKALSLPFSKIGRIMTTKTAAILAFFLVSCLPVAFAQKKDQKKPATAESEIQQPVLSTWIDTIGYLVGHDLGKRMKDFLPGVNLHVLTTAIEQGYQGIESWFTHQQSDSIMAIYQTSLSAEQQKEDEAMILQNKAASARFLAENRNNEGVIELPSGLQYQMISPGEGGNPSDTSMVTVHYLGKLMDGTVFDSSYERGEPISLRLDQVIPGWTEGLQLMKPGGKCILYIPPHLGYGDRGAGPIPPASLLIFEVELVRVEN